MREFKTDVRGGVIDNPFNYNRDAPVRTILLAVSQDESVADSVAEVAFAGAVYIRQLENALIEVRAAHGEYAAPEVTDYGDEVDYLGLYEYERIEADLQHQIRFCDDMFMKDFLQEALTKIVNYGIILKEQAKARKVVEEVDRTDL
jgi:hypothetical protein